MLFLRLHKMKKLLFLSVFFVMNNVYSQDTLVIDKSKWTGSLQNGLRHGFWREYSFFECLNDYKLKSEGNFINGKEHGFWKFYGVSHQCDMELQAHGNFVNGKKEEKWIYEGGYGYYTGYYKDDVKQGVWLRYDREVSDSNVYIKENYIDGIPEGLWELYDPENGNLLASGKMSKGQMVGLWKTSCCIGELKIIPDTIIYTPNLQGLVYDIEQDCEDLYQTSNKIGEWKYFFEDSNILSATGKYIDGKKEGKWIKYHLNGIIEYEGTYINGKKEGIWEEYYDNGQTKGVETYRDGKLNGNCSFYTKDGHLAITGSFTNGSRSGEWKSFLKDGIIMATGNYNGLPDDPESERPAQSRCGLEKSKYPIENILNLHSYYLPVANREGSWVEFHPDGTLKERGRYINGKKEGQWEEYHNGNLTSIFNYKNGLRDGEFVEFNWHYKYVWRCGTYEGGEIKVTTEFKEAEGQTKEEYLLNHKILQ